jgi:hypothetical protein
MALLTVFGYFPQLGTTINFVNLALPTTHPFMGEVTFYIEIFTRYIQILQIEPGAG